ncbi:MAG: hypothetical protein K5761_08705 [Clostridiales bacterium]|nr:hypothetical protein [Clostridiales bacterium]
MDLNMDLKDLFKKKDGAGAGKGKGKDDGRRNKGITQFLEKNPKMKIIIPAILLAISLLVAVVIVWNGLTNQPETASIPPDGKSASKVKVLPEDVRDKEEVSLEDEDLLDKDGDLLSHPVVKMVMYNSDGYYTVVVETDTASYSTLQVGDHVGNDEDSWLVEKITEKEVTFSLGDETIEVPVKF